MTINQEAKKFLDSCRVIGPCELKEGLIVCLTASEEFKVVHLKMNSDGIHEETMGVFGIFDIIDENDNKMILNFKKEMKNIIGRKKYYVETGVYKFLANEEDPFEDLYDEEYDDAKERAEREAAEEEEAEHEFERFLRAQEES